jgi:ribonuclease HI
LRRIDDHKSMYELELESGSLLLMGPGTQEHYQHCIRKMGVKALGEHGGMCKPRINLTFRAFPAPPLPQLVPCKARLNSGPNQKLASQIAPQNSPLQASQIAPQNSPLQPTPPTTTPPIRLYTDGACQPNPGKGGWAYMAFYASEVDKQSKIPLSPITGKGGSIASTNNIMELTAAIKGLEDLKNRGHTLIHVYTDSTYVWRCATGHCKKNANKELWDEYDIVSKGLKVEWFWIKAHSGDLYNDMVDKMAVSAIPQ